jgi:hemoglobin-like flavoprotein
VSRAIESTFFGGLAGRLRGLFFGTSPVSEREPTDSDGRSPAESPSHVRAAERVASVESETSKALPIEALESSFQEIAPRGEAFVAAFYDRLFFQFPQTRAFFTKTDMKEQKKQLLGALVLVIQNLRKPDVLVPALQGLGQRHAGYGVRPEHYPAVRAVLLETFAEFLGERWTPELQAAWGQAYDTVAALMLQGVPVAALA